MTINIKLEGSRLTVVDPCPIIADGSIGTVKFRVEPDADWDGLAITVVFRRVHALGSEARKVVVSDRAAEHDVPHEVLHDGWLYIGAAGVASGGTVKLTTAKMDRPIRVYESEDAAADPSGSITQEVADQILALIGTVSNLDTTDKSSLVAAINEVFSNTKAVVKTVNQIAPNVRGDVQLFAKSINTQVQSLDYQGSVEDALAAIAKLLCANDEYQAELMRSIASAAVGMTEADTIGMAIINSTDGVNGDIARMFIERSAAENDAPPTNGDVTVPSAQRVEEMIRKNAYLPVAFGDTGDSVAYITTGDDLPTVQTKSGSNSHAGKGKQIVFIPRYTNASSAPTLQLNGGEVIQIRLRAPNNRGSSDQSPDATLPVPAGMLMTGVPYTMTFCGKYWLVDSAPYSGRLDITADYAAWSTESGKTVENYAKTLPDGSYRVADDTIGRYEIEVFTVVNGQQWRIIRDYTDEFCYISVYCGSTLAVYIDSGIGDVQVGGRKLLTNDNIPLPTAANAGNVLTVNLSGSAEWMEVYNAEEVAV